MLRVRWVLVFAAAVLALVGVREGARAQAGCQPTIMQPCTNVPPRTANPAPGQRKSAATDDDREPRDHSPRIQLDRDTEFKFGTGGIGLGRKF